MSTLKVGTIQDTSGNNSSTPNEVANGRAKAWINFNGTGTVAIRGSFNVASITDHATGDYTINFTNSLSNANFVVAGTSAYDFNHEPRIIGPTGYTASSVRIETGYSAFYNQDENLNNVVIFGD